MMSGLTQKKIFLEEKEMDGVVYNRNNISCMLTYRYMEGLLYCSLYTYEYNLLGNPFPPKKSSLNRLQKK